MVSCGESTGSAGDPASFRLWQPWEFGTEGRSAAIAVWVRLISRDEVPFVSGDHHSQLADLAPEPGFDYCRAPADHERLVG
jgi:hypothetical protein